MSKRTKRDIIGKAVPDLLGNKTVMVKSNFVEFPIPFEVYEKLRTWLRNGDGKDLEISGAGQNRIIILNKNEQRLYAARGYKDN